MERPPFDDGADHTSVTRAFPPEPATFRGKDGADCGVTAVEAVLYVPIPALLTAATLKTYAIPFAKPLTVTEVVADIPSANVDQLAPLFEEN